MRRFLDRALLLFAIAGAAGTFHYNSVAEAQPVRSPIQVFVDASTKNDGPVIPDTSKLTASIDGKPAQVLSTRSAQNEKLLFAVMVDTSSSGVQQQRAIKESAIKIFQALSNSQSQGYLVLFNIQTDASSRPVQLPEAQTLLDHAKFGGATSLYDSVAEVAAGTLSRSQNLETPRRLIILLTDGKDNYSKTTLEGMQNIVQREGVSVFVLSEDKEDVSSKLFDLMSDFARSTGGRATFNENMPNGVPALVAAVRNQLMLTLFPSQAAGGELHSFSVKVSDKGVSITAPSNIPIP